MRICGLHGMRCMPVAVVLALAATMTRGASAQDLELDVRQGFDGNVFQVGGPTTGATRGPFTRLSLSYRSPSLGNSVRIRLEPWGEAQWYPQTSTRNGIAAALPVRIRADLYRPSGSRTRVILDGNLFGSYERKVFLTRSVREELAAESVNPNVPLGELPQRIQLNGAATLRTRLNPETSFRLGALGGVREYRNSTDPTIPDYERLNHQEFGVIGGTTLRFSSVTLEADVTSRFRNNPDKPARDATGTVVPGQNRQLRYLELLASFDVDPEGAIDNRTHVFVRRRSDGLEGYYDYDEWEAGNRLRLGSTRSVRAVLSYAFGRRVYDLFGPSGSPTSNTYHDARGAIEVGLTRPVRLVLEIRYDQTISNDPALDYSRFRAFAELRIQM